MYFNNNLLETCCNIGDFFDFSVENRIGIRLIDGHDVKKYSIVEIAHSEITFMVTITNDNKDGSISAATSEKLSPKNLARFISSQETSFIRVDLLSVNCLLMQGYFTLKIYYKWLKIFINFITILFVKMDPFTQVF